jgi:hypothetical protein
MIGLDIGSLFYRESSFTNVTMSRGLPHHPSPCRIIPPVKKSLPSLSFRRVNPRLLFSRLAFEPAGIAILRPSREDSLALKAGLREDSQSFPQPVPLNDTAGEVYCLTKLDPSLGQRRFLSFSCRERITTSFRSQSLHR